MRPRGRLLAALLAAACAGDDGSGAWEFKVDTLQASAGGSPRHSSWLRSVGKEGAGGEARTKPVILSFDCFPGTQSARIMTDQALRQGSVETLLKVDGDSGRRIPAFAGTTPTGGQVVLTIPQESVLALLDGRRRALIEYADGAGSSRTTAEFPLMGLEKYRAPFSAACAGRGGAE